MTDIFPVLIFILTGIPVAMLILYLLATLGLHLWRDFMDQYNE